jgi:glucosamine 6-phosphate synthetase-like amidotransferase/phosphosugar isomerase protein
MCGIFGFVRAEEAPEPSLATDAFFSLGHLAQERGRDASGFALVTGHHDGPATDAGPAIRHRRVALDGCLITKAPVPFAKLWDPSFVRPLNRAAIALGHSRWATRGNPRAVANASPMVVGRLIGTHNGDVDEMALCDRYDLAEPIGGTDTEVLLAALASVATEPRAIASVLASVWGRAALAWVDRSDPTRVHLARTALSPLVTARDWAGNFYWASNPRWFRVLDAKGAYGFRDVTVVREGTYLRVRGGLMPGVEVERSFTAHARERDVFSAAGVWRGFDGADMRLDRARSTHVIVDRARRLPATRRPQPGRRGAGRPSDRGGRR